MKWVQRWFSSVHCADRRNARGVITRSEDGTYQWLLSPTGGQTLKGKADTFEDAEREIQEAAASAPHARYVR